MTDKPTPTDVDLWEIHVALTGHDKDPIEFARAVLAKWGQPSGAEEPFCWYWENTLTGGMGVVEKNPETLGINMSHPDYKWTALYTAPQSVARETLTDGQIHAIYDEVARREPYAGAVTRRNIVRAIEAAHGIKGGQHGTE